MDLKKINESPNLSRSALRFLAEGGEMGALMRAHDWSQTSLGPPQEWSQPLRIVIRLMLNSSHAIALFWGPQHIFFYNDTYRASLGSELHPRLLGADGREGWKDIWEIIGPQISLVMRGDGATWHENHLVPILRHGHQEEAYWTYGYSPIHDDSAPNSVGGVLVVCSETTSQVVTKREAAFRLHLEDRLRDLADAQAVKNVASEALGRELQTDFVAYSELDKPGEFVVSEHGWGKEAAPVFSAERRLDLLGTELTFELRAGRTITINDIATKLPSDQEALVASFQYISTRSLVMVPLFRSGRLEAILSVLSTDARAWKKHEVTTIEEVAGRVWSTVVRLQSVADLVETEARFEAITNSIDHMVWSSDAEGFHDYFNERWYEYTGTRPGSTDGEAWRELFHADDQERIEANWRHSLLTGAPYRIEYRLRHHSGRYRWVLGRAQAVRNQVGQISRWYGTCTDIHELVEARNLLARSRDELEEAVQSRTAELMLAAEQLRQSQKMEAIGQLTGGIAHDFNNMLAVVMAALSALRRTLAANEPNLRHIEAATESARRSAMLVKRLLAFSRQQSLSPKNVDINKLVEGMSDLLSRTLGEPIRIVNQLSKDLWLAYVDPNQLENVILNLAVNSRDAMPEGGVLNIVTRNVELLASQNALSPEMKPGNYVMLSVSDDGTGIPGEIIDRVFDPFFTTKPTGKGTGLGLSQVYGFLKQSGGYVNIRSNLETGTSVDIYLPRLLREDAGPTLPVELHAVKNDDLKKMILVVDDLAYVRKFVIEGLTELGYSTMEADGGLEALRLIDLHPEISLVLTDLVMTDINGRILAQEIRRRHPNLRILFMSGYAPEGLPKITAGLEAIECLWKPFTVGELAKGVAQVLEAPIGTNLNPV